MANARAGREQHVVSTEAALTGILALFVEARERQAKGSNDTTKIEVLLSRAGLTNEDIATVTGKQADAVRKVLERAKPSKRSS